jgi:hypothetical protein
LTGFNSRSRRRPSDSPPAAPARRGGP